MFLTLSPTTFQLDTFYWKISLPTILCWNLWNLLMLRFGICLCWRFEYAYADVRLCWQELSREFRDPKNTLKAYIRTLDDVKENWTYPDSNQQWLYLKTVRLTTTPKGREVRAFSRNIWNQSSCMTTRASLDWKISSTWKCVHKDWNYYRISHWAIFCS